LSVPLLTKEAHGGTAAKRSPADAKAIKRPSIDSRGFSEVTARTSSRIITWDKVCKSVDVVIHSRGDNNISSEGQEDKHRWEGQPKKDNDMKLSITRTCDTSVACQRSLYDNTDFDGPWRRRNSHYA
jgi:hypothetical protein